MLTRRTVIYTAVETTYGTDPAMTGSNALLAWDVDLDIKSTKLDRDILRDTLSPIPHAMGLKDATLTFKSELKGIANGTAAGTCPELNMLVGCGFGTAALSGTMQTYSLVSNEVDMNSLSFYVYKDGNRHKITGARGTVKLTLEAGKYGVWDWTFNGKYNAVEAVAIPTNPVSGNVPPVCYAAGFQIGGFSPVSQKVELDLGNTVTRRDDLNATAGVNSFRITERKPKMSFNADAVVESSNPFWGDLVGAVVDTYSFLIGSTAGNKISVSGYFEYETNKYADSDGISIYECAAALITSDAASSNQEITIKYA